MLQEKSCFITFYQPSLVFHFNFLFQLRLEKELLVDQDLIFQSKQILNWLKQKLWLVISQALYLSSKKFNVFNFLLVLFCSWNQGAHLHFISHARSFDVIWALTFAEWKSSFSNCVIHFSVSIDFKIKSCDNIILK